MITIVDYDTGNLRSVMNAFDRLGASYRLSSSASEIASADKVFLPGVGEASCAMTKLRERGLADVIRELKQPTLGICVGMQLMCSHSEEGDTQALGIFPNRVVRFTGQGGLKVPHMGWNTVTNLSSPLMRGIEEGSYVYYVHSYGPEVNEYTIAATEYGERFSGALAKDNFFGCQFHPEKSGTVGEQILRNFCEL